MASIYFISLAAYGMHSVFTVVGTFIFWVQRLGAGRNVALMIACLLPVTTLMRNWWWIMTLTNCPKFWDRLSPRVQNFWSSLPELKWWMPGSRKKWCTNSCLSSASKNFDTELMMDRDLDILPQFLRQNVILFCCCIVILLYCQIVLLCCIVILLCCCIVILSCCHIILSCWWCSYCYLLYCCCRV
jgi:hypothetical protein